MNVWPFVRRWLAPFFLILGCFMAIPHSAHADIVDEFADLLEYLEVGNVSQFPVTSSDIRNSKNLFICIDKGTDVITCVHDFKDTDVGKKLVAESGIPIAVWTVLDAYIAFKESDYWSVIYYAGQAAICIVAQVMTAGTDICGIIQSLVELAKGAWDAAVAVVAWIKDALETIGDAVVCAFSSCDNMPPEQKAYAWFYAPALGEGVLKKKAWSPNDYDALQGQLRDQALAKFPLSTVNVAEGAYIYHVNNLWDLDMLQGTLPELGAKRSDFNAKEIPHAANYTLNIFQKTSHENGFSPSLYIINYCRDYFSNMQQIGNASMPSIERWIGAHRDMNVKTNIEWCGNHFNASKEQYRERFLAYLRNNSCPLTNSALECESTAAYKSCRALLGELGSENICNVNVAKLGQESAEHLAVTFKNLGSLYPCTATTGAATAAVDFVCNRPVQVPNCGLHFNQFADKHKLPRRDKILRCVQGEATDSYKQMMARVLEVMNQLKPDYEVEVPGYGGDPLVLRANDFPYEDMNKYKDFGYLLVAHRNPIPIDGLDKPTIWNGFDSGGMMAEAAAKATKMADKNQLAKAAESRVDPIVNVGSVKDSKLSVAGSITSADSMIGANAERGVSTMKGVDAMKSSTPLSSAGGAAAGVATVAPPAAGQGGQAQVMSGQAPPGSMPPVPQSPAAAVASRQSTLSAHPDITATTQLSIAGMTLDWGGSAAIDARVARVATNGVCTFPVQYTLRNNGAGAAGTFKTTWTNSALRGNWSKSWPGMGPGSSLVGTETINLKPGQNTLMLTLDQENQVKETNRGNNIFRVTVNVTGTCGAIATGSPPVVQPSAPAEATSPAAPQPLGGPPVLRR